MREVVRQLELVTEYEELSPQEVRRLPTALVVAEYGIIPYDDCRGLKADLLRWARDPEASGPSGRLYAAEGGCGKTRLALEVVSEFSKSGWKAGLLPRSSLEKRDIHGEQDGDAQLERFFRSRGEHGTLLVLDYAETRMGQIERVAKAARRAPRGGSIRIMLLAREAGEWWQDLCKESRDVQLVFDVSPVEGMVREIQPEARRAFIREASIAFARQLKAAVRNSLNCFRMAWRVTREQSGTF